MALTYLDSAERVLSEIAKGEPMHYRDIIRVAVEKGWLVTKGLTPEFTLAAQIGTDNRRREARGEKARFLVLGGGLYSLSDRSPITKERKPITSAIEEANRSIKERLKELLYKMSPSAFELLIGKLLSEAGYEDVEVVGRSGDGGIDIRARLTAGGIADVNAAIQVKRYKNNVQPATIRELRGSLDPDEIGVIITTSNYTAGAKEESQKPSRTPIKLVSGDDLVELLVQNGVGITRRQLEVLELSPEILDLAADKAESLSNMPSPVTVQQSSIDVVPATSNRRSAINLPNGTLLRGQLKGQTFDAVVIDGKIRYADKEYNSPSSAAIAATGWYAANGWVFWYYQDPNTGAWIPIDQLRKGQE